MSTRLFITLSLISILALSSCEKVIDVELNEADRVYVIEGQITNIEEMNYVKITKSDDFYETNDFESTSDAIVTVTDENGNSYSFSETDAGIYTSPGFVALSYTTYNLSVSIDGEEFTASSYMPGNTEADSIPTRENAGGFFGDGYTMFLYWTDPGDEQNYYRTKNYKKSVDEEYFTPDEGISVTDDALFNGISTGTPIFTRTFDLGDTIIVDVMEIDEHNYKYWYALSQVNSGQTAAPGNPKTNLSGDVLGYFGAYNISRDTVVVE